uniref:Kazal-like domain-containing protein n=1 Tax=Poecilia mexicana TaxID=48701 RepID=A0A3B3YYN4_9TELE
DRTVDFSTFRNYFRCNKKYVPVCGSNGDTYQNECFLRRAACKKQRAISIVSEGACYHGNTHPLTSST